MRLLWMNVEVCHVVIYHNHGCMGLHTTIPYLLKIQYRLSYSQTSQLNNFTDNQKKPIAYFNYTFQRDLQYLLLSPLFFSLDHSRDDG